MQRLWSLVAAGCAESTEDLGDLRERLNELLRRPEYGTGWLDMTDGRERERQMA